MIHELIIRIRILKLQNIQMELLKEMNKQLNDFHNNKCEKVYTHLIKSSELIQEYIDKLKGEIHDTKRKPR